MTDESDGGSGLGPFATAGAVREDLRRVARREDTADPPLIGEYETHGEWAVKTVADRLGGGRWSDALDAAGLDGDAARARSGRDADADGLRQDLQRVAARDDTADPPTMTGYDAHGEWAATTVTRRLGDGSWGDALDAAGLGGPKGRSVGEAVGDATLCEDLRRVADRDDTGDPPTIADYRRHGEWGVSTVRRRLGDWSWAAALDAAGLDGDAARERGPGGAPDEAALRRDLRRVADRADTGDPPTKAEYDAHGEWSSTTVGRRLGGDGRSWAAALDAAGLDGDAARERAAD